MAVAMPANPDQAPMALERSWGANVASRIARLPGVSSAPPTPCRILAPTRNPAEGATPHSNDAAANQTTPMTNRRRRPKRSPSAPPSSRSPASERV